jgi:2-methylisocitrate lyase-like PEP mutase family enzyme
MDTGTKLREELQGSEIAMLATVHDALSAKLAEAAGFSAAILGSSTVTNALLGLPDTGFLTLTEMELVLARTASVCEVPVLVDADTGYGNAINVVRTVRTLEQAGAAGMFFEDQQDPPRAGTEGLQLLPPSEMVGKIKAAVDSRRRDSFVVIARTDAWASEGIDSVIERGQQYVEAGADAFFAYAFLSTDEMRRVASEVPASFHISSLRPGFHVDALKGAGYNAAVVGRTLQVGAVASLRHLRQVRQSGMIDDAALEEFSAELDGGWQRFTGADWARHLEERYLR